MPGSACAGPETGLVRVELSHEVEEEGKAGSGEGTGVILLRQAGTPGGSRSIWHELQQRKIYTVNSHTEAQYVYGTAYTMWHT